jgi:hypothetical protein
MTSPVVNNATLGKFMPFVSPILAVLAVIITLAMAYGRFDNGATLSTQNMRDIRDLESRVIQLQSDFANSNGRWVALTQAMDKFATELGKNTTAVAVLTDRLERPPGGP